MSVSTSNHPQPEQVVTSEALGTTSPLDQCTGSICSFRNLLLEVKNPSAPSSPDGSIELRLLRNNFSPLGTVTLSKMTGDQIEGFIAKLWEIFSEAERSPDALLSEQQLIAVLGATEHVRFSSSLGPTRESVIQGYLQLRTLDQDQSTAPVVTVLDLSPNDHRARNHDSWPREALAKEGAFRWYIVNNPDEAALSKLRSELKLDEDFIVACRTPAANLRTSEGISTDGQSYLSITIGEIRSPLGRPEQLTVNPICCALGNGFLVTVTHGESAALERVKGEVLDGDRKVCGKIKSNNYLLCRIIGSLIHHAEEVLNAAESKADALVSNARAEWRNKQSEDLAGALDRAMILAARFVTPIPAVIRSLQQQEYLYLGDKGTPHPRLEPYLAITQSLVPDIAQIRAQIDLTRNEWRSLEERAQTAEERQQTGLGLKLAVLGALAIPIGTVFSYWGVEIASRPIPESWFIPSVGAAVVCSAAMLWGVRKAFGTFRRLDS